MRKSSSIGFHHLWIDGTNVLFPSLEEVGWTDPQDLANLREGMKSVFRAIIFLV
jgi:hypothetical protein